MRRYARSRTNLKDYMSLADTVYVFDATQTVLDLIWRRNGEEFVCNAAKAAVWARWLSHSHHSPF
jgi:predicted ABC-type ATPase